MLPRLLEASAAYAVVTFSVPKLANPHSVLSRVVGLLTTILVIGNLQIVAEPEVSILYVYDAGIQVENVRLSADQTKLFITGWRGDSFSGDSFQILDVTDAAAPSRIAGISNPFGRGSNGFAGITETEDLVFVNSFADGLLLIDVSTPSQPALIGSYPTVAHNVVVSACGKLAFVGAGDDGLRILDISDPSAPRQIGLYDMPDASCQIDGEPVFHGNCSAGFIDLSSDGAVAFVPMVWGGLHIVDVRNPSSPELIAIVPVDDSSRGPITRVKLSADQLTAYTGGGSFRMIDVTSLFAPSIVATQTSPFGGIADFEFTTEDHAFLLDGSGLNIVKVAVGDRRMDFIRRLDLGATYLDLELAASGTVYLAGGILGLIYVQLPPLQFNEWPFEGFFPPVDNPPALNIANAGATIPLKFSLGGDRGPNIFQAGFPVSHQISCEAFAAGETIPETTSSAESVLRYDAQTDQYIYLWKTERAWVNTCRQIVFRFLDGSSRVANVSFGR